jgi:hypothetical protein
VVLPFGGTQGRQGAWLCGGSRRACPSCWGRRTSCPCRDQPRHLRKKPRLQRLDGKRKNWVKELTFGIANLSQALLGCGSVFELEACLVCLDRGIVLTCTVKSCSLASVPLGPRGVYLDALEGLRSVPCSVSKRGERTLFASSSASSHCFLPPWAALRFEYRTWLDGSTAIA